MFKAMIITIRLTEIKDAAQCGDVVVFEVTKANNPLISISVKQDLKNHRTHIKKASEI